MEQLYDLVSLSFFNINRYKILRHLLNSSREYKIFRTYVLTRDDYICQCCQDAVATQVHHIVEVMVDPRLALEPTNGIALCGYCHNLQHPWL